jgi:hypothetical protein
MMSSSTSVVDAAGPAGSAARRPAIHIILKLGAGHYRTCQQRPPRGATIDVVFKLGGGRCRTRWQYPLGGLPSTTSSTSVVDTVGPTGSAPQGPQHRYRLQTRWWTLPDPPTTPLGGPAIDIIFKLGGERCRTHEQRPLGGPTIDVVFKLGHGQCQTRPHCHRGGRHRRRLQTGWWTLLDPPVGPPGWSAIDVIFKLGGGRCETRW